MMSVDNINKLKDLKEDLESIERCHAEIMEKEALIARAVHTAADEVRRRYKQVEEPATQTIQ